MIESHVCLKKPCLVCAIEANDWKRADEIILKANHKAVQDILSHSTVDPTAAIEGHEALIEAFSSSDAGMGLSAGGTVITANGWAREISKDRVTGQRVMHLVDPGYHRIAEHSAKHFVHYKNTMFVPACDDGCHACAAWPCNKADRIDVDVTPYPIILPGTTTTLRLSVIRALSSRMAMLLIVVVELV